MACAAVRREGAVARGLRRVGARWPDAGCAEFFTMRLWLHSLVALLPGYHYNHIYIRAFIPGAVTASCHFTCHIEMQKGRASLNS